ncbi:hypothetical protein BU17DRAFT_87362 [Hysterangium stoloniferum]|nr:hypothetical protein BU17DRAFT_87362 [Hysterangium stoloniferum]
MVTKRDSHKAQRSQSATVTRRNGHKARRLQVTRRDDYKGARMTYTKGAGIDYIIMYATVEKTGNSWSIPEASPGIAKLG